VRDLVQSPGSAGVNLMTSNGIAAIFWGLWLLLCALITHFGPALVSHYWGLPKEFGLGSYVAVWLGLIAYLFALGNVANFGLLLFGKPPLDWGIPRPWHDWLEHRINAVIDWLVGGNVPPLCREWLGGGIALLIGLVIGVTIFR
jgi:hypothetical protein